MRPFFSNVAAPRTGTIWAGLLLFSAVASTAWSQGTIGLYNNPLGKISYRTCVDGVTTVYDAPMEVKVGVMVGRTPDTLELLNYPPAPMIAPGIFNGGVAYPVIGYEPGDTVYMRLVGWVGSAFNSAFNGPVGMTDVRQVTLGPTAGPGTVIWQRAEGTNVNRFKPFTVYAVLGACIRDLYVYARPSADWIYEIPKPDNFLRFEVFCGYRDDSIRRVAFTTTDGTAIAGADYIATNGVLEFGPFETNRTVSVRILSDTIQEGPETFRLNLSSTDAEWVSNPNPTVIVESGIQTVRRTPDATEVRLETYPSYRYTLESSLDLEVWNPVEGAENLQFPLGVRSLFDRGTNAVGHNFYRMRITTPN